jgi:hypothetical protein
MENKQTAIDWLVKQVKLGDKSFDEFFRGGNRTSQTNGERADN